MVLPATSCEDAITRAEQRYPEYFINGARGYAIEADHAAFDWRDGDFNTVERGRWWEKGYLPDFSDRIR